MRGVPTPEAQELEFRKHYLMTGNASASARAVGLPVDTGIGLAKRANADPEFKAARDELRARVLPDAERMLMAACEIALERLNEPPPSPEQLAQIANDHKLKSISYQDPRAQYFRGLSAALQAITGNKRLDAERAGEVAGAREVVIQIAGPEEPPPDGSAAPG